MARTSDNISVIGASTVPERQTGVRAARRTRDQFEAADPHRGVISERRWVESFVYRRVVADGLRDCHERWLLVWGARALRYEVA
jgi:hypothetical protein